MEDLADGLAATFGDLQRFQNELLNVRRALNVEDTLDQFEVLLDLAVDFDYAQIYLRDASGKMRLVRDMTAEGMTPEWAYVQWAIDNQEATVIPGDAGKGSVLLLPLIGNVQVIGVAALWVTQDSAEFTQGQFVFFNLMSNEVASRIEAHFFRERLEESQQRMVDLVESVPLGIFAFQPNRRIWLLNGTLEVMFGVRRDEAIGREYEQVLPVEVCRCLTQLLEQQDGAEAELRLDSLGSEAVLGVTITPMSVDAEGAAGSYVAVCRDLMLSREVNKLREVDALKNDFLSLVSHELRTPLTSILAYTEALLMEGMVVGEPERNEYLRIIYTEGERLTRLINDVLDLTKMEAGKMEYLYTGNDINDIVRGAVQNSAAAAEKKRHKVIMQLEVALPEVRCDADRIMQVMMNLLSNAIKYTNEGGSIRVSTCRVEADAEHTPPAVRVSVEDNGIGIAPENMSRVFSRFEQIESVEHHTDGTGLGMPICKMIIEQGHGGRLEVNSRVGVGSTFYFTIPVI